MAHSIIDFARSRLTWTTTAGSRGHWRLVAAALRIADDGRPVERFVLASQVMAGDVYGTGRLMREPPYSFQIFASANRHVIVREASGAEPRAIVTDTVAANTSGFAALEIHIGQTDVVQIGPERICDAAKTTHWPLIAEVEVAGSNGHRWQIVFPVDHINTATAGGRLAFQVETGPVLVPHTLISNRAAFIAGGFALAYVYFNRIDRIDLALWGAGPPERGREFQHFDRIEPAAITLFASA